MYTLYARTQHCQRESALLFTRHVTPQILPRSKHKERIFTKRIQQLTPIRNIRTELHTRNHCNTHTSTVTSTHSNCVMHTVLLVHVMLVEDEPCCPSSWLLLVAVLRGVFWHPHALFRPPKHHQLCEKVCVLCPGEQKHHQHRPSCKSG